MSSALKKQVAAENWDQWIDGLHAALAEARKQLQDSPSSQERLEALMRSFHLIKGSAQALGLHGVQAAAHGLETRVVSFIEAKAREQAGSPADADQLGEDLRQGLRKLDGVLARLHELTLQSAARKELGREDRGLSSLFARMETVARGLAASLGVSLGFESTGGDGIPLAPEWEAPLEAALLHAVRNSLDHGSQGRGSKLKLRLAARREPDWIVIECVDTGCGIDPERVREVARSRSARFDAEMGSLDDVEVLQLLFLPGVSLSRGVSQLSGRGYGLDIVREAVETRLKGHVRIESAPGQGVRLVLRFPNQPKLTRW